MTGAKNAVLKNFLPANFLFRRYATHNERAMFIGIVPIE
jgi:hypothetical protein